MPSVAERGVGIHGLNARLLTDELRSMVGRLEETADKPEGEEIGIEQRTKKLMKQGWYSYKAGRFMLLLAILFISGVESCWGNIGETEAQCVARYGEESNVQESLAFDVVGDRAASFQLTTRDLPLAINVIYLNGIDSHETLRNADPSHALSEQQKNVVLESERGAFQWRRQNIAYRTDRSDVTYGTENWVRSDGAIAICWMFRKAKSQDQWSEIDFSTQTYAAAQKELDRQDGIN